MSSTIGSTTTSGLARIRAAQPPSHQPGSARANAIVGGLTGLAPDEIGRQLSDGRNLVAIAGDAGVDRQALIDALVADAPADIRSSEMVTSIVEQLVEQVGGPGGRHRAPPAHPPPAARPAAVTGVISGHTTAAQQAMLEGIADLLSTDAGELATTLRAGGDLLGMIERAGVPVADFTATVERGLLFDAKA